MREQVGWLVAVLSLAPLCQAQPAEVVLWHAYRGGERAALEKVVSQCEQDATGPPVTIRVAAYPFDGFADRITATVRRGTGPDLFIYAQDRLGGWVDRDRILQPMPGIRRFFNERFILPTRDALVHREQVYGLPLNFKVLTLVYNRNLVTTPPRTTGELVGMARGLTSAAEGRYGLAYWHSNFYYQAALINAFVKPPATAVFDAAGRPLLTSAAHLASFDLLRHWIDKDLLPPNPSSALVASLFNQGKAAMVFEGNWFLGEVNSDIPYGLSLLPTVDEAGGEPMRPWITVEGVYLTSSARNPEAALAVGRCLTSAAAGRIMALEGRQNPANKAVYADRKVMANPALAHFYQQVQVGVPMPNAAAMADIWGPAATAMALITTGRASPAAALEQAQAAITK